MIHELLTRDLLDPPVLMLLATVAALIAGRYRRPVLQERLLAGAAVALFCLCFLPFDSWLARPLENQYPRSALPARVDGIVILDGSVQWRVFDSRKVQGENPSTLRILAGADLAKRFPAARLVYTGGSSSVPRVEAAERGAVGDVLATAGIAPGRALYELASRDTGENLVNTVKLVRPRPGETWILVTSAVHMPRAMAIARKLGWKMLPWPSDYISSASGGDFHLIAPSVRLVSFDMAVHEWIGLLVYRLTGRA